jgi:hypothetical protein
VVQLDGDGSVLVPQLIRNMSKHDAARTLVIFDGEKRQAAYTAPQGSHLHCLRFALSSSDCDGVHTVV